VQMIQTHLPIVANRAVLRSRRKNIAIRNYTHKCCEMFPACGSKKEINSDLLQKFGNCNVAVIDDPDLVRNYKLPQIHQAVHGGIHRKKINVDNGDRYLPDVRTRSSAEIRCLCISDVRLKIGLPLQNRSDSHFPEIRSAD
jgi:hypothetical protein